jgi:LysM repeat protein
MKEKIPDSKPDQIDLSLEPDKQSRPLPNLTLNERFSDFWDTLLRTGLGELALKIGTTLTFFILLLLVVWVMGTYYLPEQSIARPGIAQAAESPQVTPTVSLSLLSDMSEGQSVGIIRLSNIHTVTKTKPRFEVTEYEVVTGDTLFGIAEKFNLDPETILWGNQYILGDDPHNLKPGQVLNILPVNGVYYDWHAGDGLNGVASYFGVTPEDIIDYPGNHLNKETIGDYMFPNIEVGSWLIVPNGTREFVSWSAPRITRDDPAVAKIFGAGSCGEVYDGPIGTGVFLWPAVERFLSGYDWSPETNHFGIDIAGDFGHGIYASDSGVVVYAGWNDWGYGNVIVIDHGNGWQTLYAHLDSLSVGCGSPVYQGQVIGLMGSTGNSSGPHLHFEMRSDTYGKVNPWNFLQ